MKKLLLSLVALVIIRCSINAQATFQRSLYGNTTIANTSVITVLNNQYLVTGTTYPSSNNIIVALLDADGNTKWSKYFSDNTKAFDIAKATQTSDSNFIVCGETDLAVISVLKIDKQGNLLWSENISGSKYFHAYGINTGGDGSALIYGSCADSTGQPAFLLKLNETNGNLLWAQTLTGIGGKKKYSSGSFGGVAIDNDGNYVVAGSWEYFDSSILSKNAGIIAKFSSAGNYSGSKFYSTGVSLIGVTKTNDGNYIFGGGTAGFAVYLKADNKGNIIWSKEIRNNNTTLISQVAPAAANNTYLLLGEDYFANINNDGSLNWYKVPNHYTKLNFTGLAKTSDGGFTTISKRFLTGKDSAFIIKADRNGNTCSGSSNKNYTAQNIQFQQAPLTGAAQKITSSTMVTPGNFIASGKPFFNMQFCSSQSAAVMAQSKVHKSTGTSIIIKTY